MYAANSCDEDLGGTGLINELRELHLDVTHNFATVTEVSEVSEVDVPATADWPTVIVNASVSVRPEAEPGVVYARLLASSAEEMFNVLRNPGVLDTAALPEKITPAGLPLQRQWYLYEQIAPLCSSRLAASLTCPKPTRAKAVPLVE